MWASAKDEMKRMSEKYSNGFDDFKERGSQVSKSSQK